MFDFRAQYRESASRTALPAGAPRRSMRRLRCPGAFVLLLSLSTAAQSPAPPRPPTPGQIQTNPLEGDVNNPGNIDSRVEARRIAMLNAVRQKAMKTDADKLLQLAKELNDDATGSGTALTGAERIRKAGEIEKLAKNVKEKMTYVVGQPEDHFSPFSVNQR